MSTTDRIIGALCHNNDKVLESKVRLEPGAGAELDLGAGGLRTSVIADDWSSRAAALVK
jgi:hypothetical protein